jgi:hypothetical protein
MLYISVCIDWGQADEGGEGFGTFFNDLGRYKKLGYACLDVFEGSGVDDDEDDCQHIKTWRMDPRTSATIENEWTIAKWREERLGPLRRTHHGEPYSTYILIHFFIIAVGWYFAIL